MDFIKTENGFLENGIYTGLIMSIPVASISTLFHDNILMGLGDTGQQS